jgi:hypothetical protein
MGAQGIMQAAPEAANIAAEGSNAAAQQMQEQAVKQGLEQAVNPDQAMFEEMQRQMAQESANPTNFGPGTQYASANGPTPVLSNSGATSVDPFGGFPSSGPDLIASMNSFNEISQIPNVPANTTPSYNASLLEEASSIVPPNTVATPPPANPFMQAYEGASKYVTENPFKSGLGAYGLLSATGALQQKGASPPGQRTFNNPYTFSKDFKGTHPNPNDYQYAPKYPSYAMGGIANIPPQTNFANPSQSMMGTSQYDMPIDSMSGNIANRMAGGGIADVPKYSRGRQVDIYDASLRFADIMDNPNRYSPPDTRFQSVETFRDTNPNTATKSPDEAAETRRKAIEQRSYVNTGAKYLPASRRPGQLDLGPVGGERGKYDNQESVLAAQGGIMGYNLGGYASGGNPRLLRGPGDGMSDNIPATIADRQPARLADGEFVIPADVVSHLGNGSTEAGAKKLHEMMNSVRRARTGNPKQGKKINPNKFMPKK